MIKSMTGFGKSTLVKEGKSITVEIRTLNSKQLDLNTRISSLFRDKESEIRSLVTKELQRGKIDLAIYLEKTDQALACIDTELASNYYKMLSQLSTELNSPITSDIFIQALKMPDVIISKKEEITEELWIALAQTITEACAKVNEFRGSEGGELAKDIEKRVRLIDQMIDEVTPFEEARIEYLRNKFMVTLSKILTEDGYDRSRLEEELIYYIEKIDVTEEKVRLRKHCAYFLETMKEEEANGKKLGFIIQEFGREINTLGSKANDFNIQQIVVKMKDELEKIKEQLANIL